MVDYAQSPDAVRDMVRLMQLKRKEILEGLCDGDVSELDLIFARLNQLDGADAVDIIMRCSQLFVRELKRV